MYAADIATMQLKAERVKGPGAALAAALDRPRLAFVAAILRCMKKKIEFFLNFFHEKKIKKFRVRRRYLALQDLYGANGDI